MPNVSRLCLCAPAIEALAAHLARHQHLRTAIAIAAAAATATARAIATTHAAACAAACVAARAWHQPLREREPRTGLLCVRTHSLWQR